MLISCATPYQPAGLRGGYSDFEVEPGVYYVAFEGNGFTTRGVVMRNWHKRAAEICGGPATYEMLSQSDISRDQTVPVYGGSTNIQKSGFEGYVRCRARGEGAQRDHDE